MKKLMSVVVGLFLASSALAGWGVGVSVNIGGPVYTPAPVVYAPAPVVYTSPVCIPRPVYYAPVVYVPAPVVYPSPIGIVCPTPVTVQFPVVYHHHHHFRR